ITQAIVIVEAYRSETVPISDKEFDWVRILLRALDGVLEPVGGVCRSVNGNDLSSNRERVGKSHSSPQHVGKRGIIPHDHADGIGQIGNPPARLRIFEIARWRVRVHKLVTAADNTIEWRSRPVTLEARVKEFCPVIRLNTVERVHDIVEGECDGHVASIVDAEESAGEIVQRFLSV